MNTTFLLMAQFERAVVPLEEIATAMLGLNAAQAKRKAAHDELPFPAFRDGQKGPWLVRVTDVAAWVDESADAALERMAT